MPERLTENLVQKALISHELAERALERHSLLGGAIDTALFELSELSEAQMLASIAGSYGFDIAHPRNTINAVEERVLRAFPEQWAKRNLLAPISLDEDSGILTVLTPVPVDVEQLIHLGDLLDLIIKPLLSTEFRVIERLSFLYGEEPPERYRSLIDSRKRPSEFRTPPDNFSKPQELQRVKTASTLDEALHTTLAYASRYLRIAALFKVSDSTLLGWQSVGENHDIVNQVRLPLNEGPNSAFSTVLEAGSNYLGPLAENKTHQLFLKQIQGDYPTAVIIIPIRDKFTHNISMLFYGDKGQFTIYPNFVSNLILFVNALATHLQPSRPKSGPISHTPSAAPGHELSLDLDLTPPKQTNQENDSIQIPEAETLWEHIDLSASEVVTPQAILELHIEEPLFADQHVLAAATLPSNISINGEEHSQESDSWMNQGSGDWSSQSSEVAPAKPGPTFNIDATSPDLTTEAWLRASSEGLGQRAPSANVATLASRTHRPIQPTNITPTILDKPSSSIKNKINANANITPLLMELEHPVKSVRTNALTQLHTLGADSIQSIMEHFPGPMIVNPFVPEIILPTFAECGPVLWLVQTFSTKAHTYVEKYLESPKPIVRFYAAYFYTEYIHIPIIPRLIRRLYDTEANVCMIAARALFAYRDLNEFQEVLYHIEDGLTSESDNKRQHAIYLAGLFRDATSIPTLIEFLSDKNREIVQTTQDALAEITKQRLGSSPRKWRTWWEKNREQSRISWLVEALNNKDPLLRQEANDELCALTGFDFGYDESLPKKEREAARLLWIRWWNDQEQRPSIQFASEKSSS